MHTDFQLENPEGRHHLEDAGVDGGNINLQCLAF